MVGVNKYESNKEELAEMQTIDQEAVKRQLTRLCEFKETRNKEELQKALTALKKIAGGNDNLLPHIIHAVKTHATLGEISDTLREVFGEY